MKLSNVKTKTREKLLNFQQYYKSKIYNLIEITVHGQFVLKVSQPFCGEEALSFCGGNIKKKVKKFTVCLNYNIIKGFLNSKTIMAKK